MRIILCLFVFCVCTMGMIADYSTNTPLEKSDSNNPKSSDIEYQYFASTSEYDDIPDSIRLIVHDIDAYMAQTIVQFVVCGYDITENKTLSLQNNSEFDMRHHTNRGTGAYSSTITLVPDAYGVIFDTIDIRYIPSNITYDTYCYNQFILTGSTPGDTHSANFRYRNRRPIYVTAPTAYTPTDVHDTNATLAWSFVADTVNDIPDVQNYGAKYYLDLYYVIDEPQVETEEFDSFPNMISDWSANFSTYSTTEYKTGPRSALFTSSADTLYTKVYDSDIEELSFWFSSIGCSGILKVSVRSEDDGSWRSAKSIILDESTTNKDDTIKIPKGYNSARFYYVSDNGGSLAFDEVSVKTTNSIYYKERNLYLHDTTYMARGLLCNQEYLFRVRATDRDEVGAQPRYENVSDYSDLVSFVTKNIGPSSVNVSQSDDNKIIVTADNMVHISKLMDDEYKLFIFNMEGKMVTSLDVTTNIIKIPQLPVGIYVIKYSKKYSNSVPGTKFCITHH